MKVADFPLKVYGVRKKILEIVPCAAREIKNIPIPCYTGKSQSEFKSWI